MLSNDTSAPSDLTGKSSPSIDKGSIFRVFVLFPVLLPLLLVTKDHAMFGIVILSLFLPSLMKPNLDAPLFKSAALVVMSLFYILNSQKKL
jgi:hypothetical protein